MLARRLGGGKGVHNLTAQLSEPTGKANSLSMLKQGVGQALPSSL